MKVYDAHGGGNFPQLHIYAPIGALENNTHSHTMFTYIFAIKSFAKGKQVFTDDKEIFD